ncbi:MAG: DVUA0089 family protein, partial [Bacteroidota bacterium]
NDTIADAVDLGLTATNPTVIVDGEIAQRFRGEDTADASEDVDMYAFTLEAGQTILLDVDAGGVGGVEGSLLDSVLRVFDADGNELANVGNAPAPDEVFQSNGDPYLEFTALEAGTYYAAISNLGNTEYDPNVANSGSGWTFDGRFEPGAYKLNATLDVPPVVSFEVTPENFSEEDADNLVEWKWTVTGKFPAEGITVNLDTSGGGAPFAFLEQFAASPEAEFVNADIVGSDETGRINILLTEPEASFKLYFGNDILEEGAQPFEFFLVDGDGYTVDAENNGTIFTITDDNGGPGVGPTVGLTVSNTDLAEGDAFTVNFNVTGDIPPEGVQVLVQSDFFGALGQFDLADLSNLTLSGIAGLPEVGDNTGSSFLVTITEPQASIGLSVFDDIVAEDVNTINFTLA